MNTLLKTTATDHKEEVEHLNRCVVILKDHLEYLREKLKEKEEQLELFSATILAMDEELKKAKSFDLKQISLN